MEHEKKSRGFLKKSKTYEKIMYLEENLAVIKSQRHISAVESIGKMYKKNKEISEKQEMYLDIIVENVKKVRSETSRF